MRPSEIFLLINLNYLQLRQRVVLVSGICRHLKKNTKLLPGIIQMDRIDIRVIPGHWWRLRWNPPKLTLFSENINFGVEKNNALENIAQPKSIAIVFMSNLMRINALDKSKEKLPRMNFRVNSLSFFNLIRLGYVNLYTPTQVGVKYEVKLHFIGKT